MRKFIYFLCLTLFAISIPFQSCVSKTRNTHDPQEENVQCYTQTMSNGELLFWYMLLRPNGTTYYYSSPTPIDNYSSVNWSTDNNGFNQSSATYVGDYYYSESNGFQDYDSDMSSYNSTESSGFSSYDDYNSEESSGFEDNSSFESSSSDFDSGDSGGSFDSGESGGFGE